MKEYVLKKWYPSLPTDWHFNDKKYELPIIVVERDGEYHLHTMLKGLTRFAVIPEREVERNGEFWEHLISAKK